MEDLVTHRFPLEQVSEAYASMGEGKRGKVAVVFDEELRYKLVFNRNRGVLSVACRLRVGYFYENGAQLLDPSVPNCFRMSLQSESLISLCLGTGAILPFFGFA